MKYLVVFDREIWFEYMGLIYKYIVLIVNFNFNIMSLLNGIIEVVCVKLEIKNGFVYV